MATKVELKAKLSLDKSGFSRGLKKAKEEAKEFGKSVAEFATGALIERGFEKLIEGALEAAKALADGVREAYNLGSELQDMSDKTGIAADQIMILQQAAKDNGIEDITGAVGKMQKNLIEATKKGSGPAAEAFQELGLRAEDLVNKLPTEQLDTIGRKIMEIRNPALRAAEAMDIFGKQGREILPLFADAGALGTAAKSIGKQAQILRDSSGDFDKISDRLGRAGLKLQGFFVGIAADILPYMDEVTKRFDDLDLADQGKKFGEGIKTAVDFIIGVFKDPGKLWDVSIDYLKAGLLGVAELWAKRMIKNAAGFAADFVMYAGRATSVLSAGIKFAFQSGMEFFTTGWEKFIVDMSVGFTGVITGALALFMEGMKAIAKGDFSFDVAKMASGLAAGLQAAMATIAPGKHKSFSEFYDESQEGSKFEEFANTIRKSGDDFANKVDFGAAKFAARANRGASQLTASGHAAIARAINAAKPENPAVEQMRTLMGGGWGALSGFGGLRTGGLSTGRLATGQGAAYNQTGILSHSEIMRNLNTSVASGAAGRDVRRTNRNAYGVIHSGDRSRANGFEKQEAEKKLTLEGTNERLDKVIALLGHDASPVKPQGGK